MTSTRRLTQQGFTLLEVMIAMFIIAIGISAILVAENNSLEVTLRAKRMTTVAMLAKNAMIQAEREIEGKTFDETKKEASGTFDAPYSDFKWERKIKEITFPNIMDSSGVGAGAPGDASSASSSAASDQMKDPNVEKIVKTATNYLSKSTREVTITILWTEKKQEQSFIVSQYWVDLKHAFDINDQ
ncbi:MAG: prepilin-type N-terminal cleavage/methylation domain-containing protein [Bdellovibrionales bacterium]|nr:prepilin-type N-terminal cleavage/methylation domain-containing protein [Bdellovibrionales bacterium]